MIKKPAIILLASLVLLSCTLFGQEFMKEVAVYPETDTIITVNGKHIHTRIHGKSPVGVVLINGFGASQNYWNNIIPELEKHMGIISYDREGYAESSIISERIDIKTTVEDLNALLDSLNINHPVIIVGHSYGGMIARYFLLSHPDRVSAIVLLDSSHELTKTKTLERLHGDDLELFKRFLTMIPANLKYPGMTKEKESMEYSEQLLIRNQNLPVIPCTVLTAGERPAYRGFSMEGRETLINIDKELQNELGSRIPGSTHIIVKDASHNIHLSNPEIVINSILNIIPTFIMNSWADTTWSMDVELADIDNDEDLDVMIANMRNKPAMLWLNDGNGNLMKSRNNFLNPCHGIAMGDIDNDKDIDIVLIPNAREPGAITIWKNDGFGNYTDTKQKIGTYNRGLDAVLKDFDNDGDLDMYLMAYKNPNEFYLNNGEGRFSCSEDILEEAQHFNGYAEDFNRDHKTDFVVKNDTSLRFYLMDNSGKYKFCSAIQDTSSGYSRLLSIDYDNDGDNDLLVKTAFKAPQFFNNDGYGNFSLSNTEISAGENARIVIPVKGDFNSDSYMDILFLIQNEPNSIWLNNKQGSFTDSGVRLDESVFAVRAATGDIDNDEDTDIIIVSGPKRADSTLIIGPNQLWQNMLREKH
jgi:pimeloyl-ACP methyl ester carboxylesterase